MHQSPLGVWVEESRGKIVGSNIEYKRLSQIALAVCVFLSAALYFRTLYELVSLLIPHTVSVLYR